MTLRWRERGRSGGGLCSGGGAVVTCTVCAAAVDRHAEVVGALVVMRRSFIRK